MSGIQVAQGQERFIKTIGDYTENQSTNKIEYITGQNVGGRKRAMDVVFHGTYIVTSSNVIEAGSTTRVLKKTAHGSRENDIIHFTSGNNSGIAIQILSCPDADTMILAASPEFTSAVGDTFNIKRYVSPQYDSNGALSVSTSTGAVQYNLDGVATEVAIDTSTPANTKALPVEIMGSDGTRMGINASAEVLVHDTDLIAKDFATQTTLLAGNVLLGAVNESAPVSDTASSGLNGRLQRIAQRVTSLIAQIPASLGIKSAAESLSIAPASDAVFSNKPKAITGSYDEDLAVTTVITFSAPANAIGALVQGDDTNTVNFRAKQGGVATATSGIQLQGGRTEFFRSGSDISVCSESASVKVYVQWFIQA